MKKIIYIGVPMLLLASFAFAVQVTGNYTLDVSDDVPDYLNDRAGTQQAKDDLITEIAEQEIQDRYERLVRDEWNEETMRIEELANEGNYTAMEAATTALELI